MSQHIQTFTVDQWVHADFPVQVMLLAMMIWRTERTEDTLRRAAGKNQKAIKEITGRVQAMLQPTYRYLW